MTRPEPATGPATARWCAALGDTMTDVGRRLGQLAEQIATDWPDQRGREWAERVARLRLELGREAAVAAELGRQVSRYPADDGIGPATPPPAGARATPRTGVRLGGTSASRADDERGMRIAELADDGPAAP